jgi:hypothetical protein
MRIKVFLSLALAAGFTGNVLGRPLPKPFIVRISEWYTTLNSTAGPINLGNCLIVLPDGGLHLELRRQEFFDGRAVLTTYESALDATEIGILLSILDDAGVSPLHAFAQPAVPMRFDHIEVFRAEIARAAQVQEVGYLTWQGEGPHNPEADKTAWKEASVALQPIVEWSHDVKSHKNWRRVHNPKTTCGE